MAEDDKVRTVDDAQAPGIAILRVFNKDLSFESPQAPQVFTKEFRPDVRLNVSTQARGMDPQTFEVVLELTAEAKHGEETVYIVEVEQAGLFRLTGLTEDQKAHALGVFCPNVLFPYARQVVDQMLVAGTFPPLTMAPIDFEQLWRQRGKSKQPPPPPKS